MVKLHGRVLELFLKDKKENKITNIVYGKKALDKYVDASFKNRDEKDKKKYLKRWDSSKLSNSVYFVYQSRRGKGHRFISNASKKGGYSYLGHLESNNNKSFRKRIPLSVRRKRSRSRGRRRVQTPEITRSIYYYKENDKYKPLYSHKYMKDFESTGKKSYVIYRKTKNSKDKPFYGRFYRKSEIKTKPNKKYSKKKLIRRSVRRKVQKGGYPFWYDDVPEGMSRSQYMKLSKSKPKNKSMKVWIRENKKNMKKYTKKIKRSRGRRRVQKGGFACAPCLMGPIAGAFGVGTAGYLVSRSSSTSIVNGKKSLKRKEVYEMNKNGKKVRKTFIQDGLNLKLAGKKVKAKSLKKSINRFNKAVERCIKSGFKKC